MAIVLRERTHTHDAVQPPRRLIAVALAKLAKPQRQVTVALDALLVNQDVSWAIHGLERVVALFTFGDKHVFTVLVPMPGFLPQALVQNLRALHLLVAVLTVDLTHVLLNLLPQRPTLGVPKHGAWRVVIDMKKVQLPAQFAVVPLFGFFQHRQMLLQLVFGGPGGAVNAL